MDATWTAEVAAGLAWAQERISELGWPAAGMPVQVRVKAWSAVYMIPAGDARLWFKASGGGARYEAALTRALAQWAPGQVLAPLAVHAGHGWQLLPDGGTPLRQQPAGRDHRAWERFAGRYAELQRAVSPHTPEMLILGVPDHRPEMMPGRLAELLRDPAVAFSTQARSALRALQGRYASACARLAQAGPAPTIQHDDLHSGNILRAPTGDWVFDWGDASVAHPFTSLLIALRAMADTFGLPPGDPLVLRFRDAYLEPWGLGRDGPELAELAAWTGMAGRALAWRRALAAAGPAELAEYGDRVSGWAAELLEPFPPF
jgi:Phosphotransferase enzyme family